MLSLESTDKYEELEKFNERTKKKSGSNQIEYLCELKIDGLSASLHYQQGRLKKIVTRGDGWTGEDVSIDLPLIQDLPNTLFQNPELFSAEKAEESIEIRGEIYMKKEEFQRLNEGLKKKGLPVLANPRNAAAGTLRTLIPTQQRKLHFFAYQILGVDVVNNKLKCLEKLTQ